MDTSLKLMAITSLPTVGNAGLKNIISILGNDVIPVPSVIACGLGNMTGHTKIEASLKDTLEHTLSVAKTYRYRLIVYIGYLSNAHQIDVIKSALEANMGIIDSIIMDPVSGDNGKAYVDDSIVSSFGKLMSIADYIIPNETEIRLLLGNDFETAIDKLMDDFMQIYPDVGHLIVTSSVKDGKTYNAYHNRSEVSHFEFASLDSNYSGTGDLFAALFVKYRFFHGSSTADSIEQSANYIKQLIAFNKYFDHPTHDIKITQIPDRCKGRLNYVIGPSGVGKDTLLDIAKKELSGRPVVFVKRYITRPADAGGESHIALTKAEFEDKLKEKFFSLWWESQGNYYGVPSSIDLLLDHGYNVVVNGSRGYYEKAIEVYPNMNTILITAQIDTIRKRLIGRGRESEEEIEKRLERSQQFFNRFENEDVSFLSNDGSLETSSKNFIKLLDA